MTKDDIIRMAREAGLERIVKDYANGPRIVEVPNLDLLERFAALVAAAERNACAKVCDANGHPNPAQIDQAKICAAAIRARGQG